MGKRLSGDRTKVQVSKWGQYQVTIPKPLARSHSLTSKSIIRWEHTRRGLLAINEGELEEDET